MRREDSVLSLYNMTMKEFKKDGRKKLGERIFDGMNRKLEAVKFSADFIVFGFAGGKGHVFSVGNSMCVQDHTKPGFAAIGTGSFEATSMMYFQGFSTLTSLPQAVYKVCAAKFMAETASDIGESTIAAVVSEGTGVRVDFHLIDEMREAWKEQMQRVPKREITDKIEEWIKTGAGQPS